jgi:hypothetical protein
LSHIFIHLSSCDSYWAENEPWEKRERKDHAQDSEESQAGASSGEVEAFHRQAFGQRPSQVGEAHQRRAEEQEPPSQSRLNFSGWTSTSRPGCCVTRRPVEMFSEHPFLMGARCGATARQWQEETGYLIAASSFRL